MFEKGYYFVKRQLKFTNLFYKRYIQDYAVGDDHRILFDMKLRNPHTKVWAEKEATC